MSLAAGTRLGPYEVLAPLGAGGMGEVYRGRDTRLGRTVAIKVLPHNLAANPIFRERFDREAHAVSSLNHPHICTLYDIGDQDGVEFLVMELLEGESLADRLKKGALPVDQALRYGIEIAEALDAAHRRGVLHRDLKPPNIFLTPNGAKLLDFGLAKVHTLPAQLDANSLPEALTQQGMLLGTPQYLAPEQFQGAEADERSDIFTFGAVLYEMLTGQRAFEGKTGASVMAAVLHFEPPPATPPLPGVLSPALDRVVRICLEKDPNDRWQRARDVLRELQWISQPGAAAPAATSSGASAAPPRLTAYWAAIAVLLVAVLSLAGAYFRTATPEPAALRLTLAAPEKTQFASFALSPNGRSLAIAATGERGRQLWVRNLDSFEAQPLAGTEDAQYPFFSPDGRDIGFFAQGKLRRIPAGGGPPQTLCDAPEGRGGTWNRDGVILFAPATRTGLSRISAAGGTPVSVTRPAAPLIHRYPVFLPDGRRFLYVVSLGAADQVGIYVASLDSTEIRRLVADVSNPAYLAPSPENPNGYLLFVRDDILMAQPLNPRSLQSNGDVFAVGAPVFTNAPHNNYGQFAVSQNGMIVYQSGMVENQLAWLDRTGKTLATAGSSGRNMDFALSPDDRQILVTRLSLPTNNSDLWMNDLERGTNTRWTFHASANRDPVWSPDNTRVVFRSNRGGAADLYMKKVNGVGQEELLYDSKAAKFPSDWSGDGRFLIYSTQGPKTRSDLWALPFSGDRKPVPLVQGEFDETMGQVSPDGRWLAYVSNETGQDEVYVQNFTAGAGPDASPPAIGKWAVSNSGGREPRWRRDGQELFYVGADRKLMSVEIQARGGSFAQSAPRPLFDLPVGLISPGDVQYHYQPSADGKRFLAETVAQGAAPPLTVVVNWLAGLKR